MNPTLLRAPSYQDQAEILATYAQLYGALYAETQAKGNLEVADRLLAEQTDFIESAISEYPGTAWASRQAKHAIERGDVDKARSFATFAVRSLLFKPEAQL